MNSRRWWILALFFCSTVINYMDRQALSILARTIQDDLHLTDLDYSNIVQLFLLAYTIAYLVAGRLTDLLGTKLAMASFILWWSVANFCTGFARSGAQLGMFRFLLGIGEPGNWTAAPKAVSEWFSVKERSFALGINTAGATIGATLAPPLISHLALRYGWRSAFFLTGTLGILWVIPWWSVYRSNPKLVTSTPPKQGEWQRWRKLLVERETWLLTLLRMLTDPVWYFYLFWFPKYLTDARHLTLQQLGNVSWVVYLAADLGSLLTGLWVARWIARGGLPIRTEQIAMTILAFLVPLGFLIPFMPDTNSVLAVAAVVAFAQLGWQIVTTTLAVNYFSSSVIATAFGIVAAGSGFGGLLSTNIIGHLVTNYSYKPVFLCMAVLHPLSLILLWSIRRNRASSQQDRPIADGTINPRREHSESSYS